MGASGAAPKQQSATAGKGGSAFLSGATAGVFTRRVAGAVAVKSRRSHALLQPFDVIKTRLQAQAATGGGSRGMLAVGSCIAQKEGVMALWSGVGPACLRVGGGAGLYFLCLSSAQKVMAEHWPHQNGQPVLPHVKTFALGAMSRATAAFVFCPITVVKTRMEYAAMSGVKYNNTAHALLTIARQERLRGLFSGLAPTLIRDAPYSGLYLLMFSNLRDMFADGSQENSMGTFVAAMIAGSVATVVTHPPDVVRTRLQLRRNMLAALGNAAPLPAVRVGDIIRQEGILALWSGIAPRVVRRTLQQAITWTLFERLLGRRIV